MIVLGFQLDVSFWILLEVLSDHSEMQDRPCGRNCHKNATVVGNLGRIVWRVLY